MRPRQKYRLQRQPQQMHHRGRRDDVLVLIHVEIRGENGDQQSKNAPGRQSGEPRDEQQRAETAGNTEVFPVLRPCDTDFCGFDGGCSFLC
jgi:hypothetical protein